MPAWSLANPTSDNYPPKGKKKFTMFKHAWKNNFTE